MNASILPYGNITSSSKLGHAVRVKRKADGLTQAKAAALCGVGIRFISDLENGKPTIELGKTLSVLSGLGLVMDIRPKGNMSQTKVMKRTSKDLLKMNQFHIPDTYVNAISKLADSYKGSLNISSEAIDNLSKHRMDFNSLGISMDKYNDIVRNYKDIFNLSSTAASNISKMQMAIDKSSVKLSIINDVLRDFKKNTTISRDAFNSIKKLKATIGSLNLDTKSIDALQESYKNNMKISSDVINKLTKLDSNMYALGMKKKDG